ncbi:MAG: hypothetical protein Q4F97_12500 [Bacteroidales bacterium]|nr:hypothetical protein [Bacteroidales bacterium]
MKINLFLLFALTFTLSLNAQNSKDEEKICLAAPDIVYFENEYDSYFVNNSFLSDFKGYATLFSHAIWGDKFFIYNPGRGVNSDFEYVPIWIIEDSVIYFIGIDYYDQRDIRPFGVIIKTMEEFTGQKIEKKIFKKLDLNKMDERKRTFRNQAIRANWVNGTYYRVKRRRKDESYESWDKHIFDRITIKNGKITLIEKTGRRIID